MKPCDVIVIGSGIGGLTAAALLAVSGKSVLVLEGHDRPGGYAHGFRRKKYQFDAGVHLVSGCGPDGFRGGQVIYKVLTALGVEDELEFIKIDPFSHVYYPDYSSSLPQSIDAFVSTLASQFPDERQGLDALVALCLQVTEEIALFNDLDFGNDIDTLSHLLPGLCEYRKSTLETVMAAFIQDPKLRAIFASLWPYLGLPPSKVSFIYWASMLIGYMVDGACYCKGSFQQLANTLVKGIREHGGVVRFRSPVDKIVVEDDRVVGVNANGHFIAAPTVISNADMRQTIFDLVGKDHFPDRFLQKINTMQHSLSIFVVYIATDLDLAHANIGHEAFCYQDFDHDNSFARTLAGDISWLSITIPSLVDPSLAPMGEHIVMLTTLIPYQIEKPWQEVKQQYVDVMVELADQFLSGLKQHITFIEGGTPITMQRYTQNFQGAAYGWDMKPTQIDPIRTKNTSSIKGLYFAGHWCSPGCGIYGVSVSGMQVAQHVLGIKKPSSFWQYLSVKARESKIIASNHIINSKILL